MKRFLILMLGFTLLLAGCKQNQGPIANEPSEPSGPIQQPIEIQQETEPEVTEPPAPETVTATALADHTVVVLQTANRDDTIDIAGEFDENHYVVKLESGYGLIEKRLVRLDGEAPYETWSGYARSGAKLYGNYHLLPGDERELGTNTVLEIVDDLDGCLVVRMDDAIGYIPEAKVSKSYIKYSSGGSSGQDGGDISLSYGGETTNLYTNLSMFVPQSGEVSGKGTVLADGAEIILGWFDRGDSMQIITEPGFVSELEGWHGVYLNGITGYVRQNLTLTDGAEPYAQWDGYARSGAEVFDNYYLNGEAVKTLSTNTVVHVVCDLGTCYLVEIGEDVAYMAKDRISETRITYSGGGSSGGDSEWSDPVM